MPNSLLNKIMHGARRIAAHLGEKPTVKIDEHVLEHMLFYHGLSGSSPESDKETKRVRADIKEALHKQSKLELCLALKLSPHIWDERLKNIFSNLSQEEQQLAIKLLLPDNTSEQSFDFMPKNIAVYHEDWRIQANAANILSFLNAKEAIEPLVASLGADTTSSALSFCHIAYALGKLQGPKSKAALEQQLRNSDTWLRVDAAGALSYFDFDTVVDQLSQALLEEEEALDYMSYAISRKHNPAKFLQHQSIEAIKAGCLLISGVIEATQNSFDPAIVFESESHLCLPFLIELINKDGHPLRGNPLLVHTILLLSQLLASETDLTQVIHIDHIEKQILEQLNAGKHDQSSLFPGEFIATIKLAGKLNIKSAEPTLSFFLEEFDSSQSHILLDHIVETFGKLSPSNGSVLISLANRLVNTSERCQRSKSKQPVWEENAAKSKTYWQILKALGNIPTEESAVFLFAAIDDYAPDKRACALESLMTINKNQPQLPLPAPVEQILRQALQDSSTLVQMVALSSIADLNRADLITDILPLVDAHENTVSKQALSSLARLKNQGHKTEVQNALKEKIKTIREEHKKRRILDILQN